MELTDPLPDGWSEALLGTLAAVRTPPKLRLDEVVSEPGAGAWPLVGATEIVDNRISPPRRYAHSDIGDLSRYQLRAGDVVCVRTGDLGRSALVEVAQEGYLIASSCLRIRTGPLLLPEWLLYYLAHPAVREWIARSAAGSTIPSLRARRLAELPVAFPPVMVQSEIVGVLRALDERAAAHRSVVESTVELRDGLIPLLLSGELAVLG